MKESAKENEVTLIDVTAFPDYDLLKFDRIGFASGIYYSKFHKTLPKYIDEHMPDGNDISKAVEFYNNL